MYKILTVNRKLNCQAPGAFGGWGSGGAMGGGRATKRGGGRVRDNFIAQICFFFNWIVYLNLLSFFAQSCCSACPVVESAASGLHPQHENAWHHHQGS
jgi:hypothetical protein